MKKNILICDANHGGLVLLDEYSKYTSNNLFFYDIYNKLSDDEKKQYSKKYNVSFLEGKDLENKENIKRNYTTVAPVHMKNIIDKDYTHHEFTSYLVNKHRKKYGWNFKMIQVTGVKAKTTVTSMIRDVLSDFNILLLNSTELSFNSKNTKIILEENLSITPASIITALNIAENKKVLDKVDYFVTEVSLGVIPNEAIGVLTNIVEDYPIADKSFSASLAKASVFTCKKSICLKESFDKYYSDINGDVMKISLYDPDSMLHVDNLEMGISNTSFTLYYDDKPYSIRCFALADFYVLNILFAIGTALACGMNIDEAISKVGRINSIDGRTSIRKIDNRIVIEEINPGLNTSSIKKSIDNTQRLSESFDMIIGGDYGITCEEIDENRLTDYLKGLDNQIILSGELGKNLKKALIQDNFGYIADLNDALSIILEKSDKNPILIIYRSEYAKKVTLKS